MAKKISQSRTNRSAVGGLVAGVAVNLIAARIPILAPFKDELTIVVLTGFTALTVAFRQATNQTIAADDGAAVAPPADAPPR